MRSRVLVIDTETTGFAKFGSPVSDPGQPRMVQLGFQLIEPLDADKTEYEVIDEFEAVIKPDGWKIPDEAVVVHGITNEYAAEHGIDASDAIFALQKAALKAETVTAHNLAFDAFIIAIECDRLNTYDPLEPLAHYCTMVVSTDICNLPGKYGRPKWPSLQEAYRYFFDRDFEDAHTALADARACGEIYVALHQRRDK